MTPAPETLFCLQNSFADPHPASQLHMFWTESDGLTWDLNNAEVFTWDEALATHRVQPVYLPIPLDYLKARSLSVVDTGILRYLDRFRLTPAARNYVQPIGIPRPSHGMFFLDATGRLTRDLKAARGYSRDEASALAPEKVMLWPADYVDERAFLHVDQVQVDVRQALGADRYAQLSELRSLV